MTSSTRRENRRHGVTTLLLATLVLVAFAPHRAAAQEPDSDRLVRSGRDTDWQFSLIPYGWLTGVEGTVVTDGEPVEISIPFEDFFDNTRAGLQLYFEARRHRVFIGFDGTWAVLGGEQEGPVVGGGYSF